MKLRSKPIDQSAFRKIPNEIFDYLDVPSALKVRLVSQKWKEIADECFNFTFTCHLTDQSVDTAVRSSVYFKTVKIHDFHGTRTRFLSGPKGAGRVIREAEVIEIKGVFMDANKLSKIMRFGVETIADLTFRRTSVDVMNSVLFAKPTFNSLKRLTFAFNTFPCEWHTKIFNKIADKNHHNTHLFFPCVRDFGVVYELDNVGEVNSLANSPCPKILLDNYISIYRLIISLRNSVKIVEVIRNEILRTAVILNVSTLSQVQVSPYNRRLILECIEGFENVQLEFLNTNPYMDEGTYPWVLENSILSKQRQLHQVSVNRKLCAPREGIQNLAGLLPRTISLITYMKISSTCSGDDPINLAVLEQCPNLKTLWLAFYRGVRTGPARRNSIYFSNVDKLPISISNLHFKSSQSDSIIIHQQALLDRDQLRWIIQNMKNLESFWCQLVVEGRNEGVDNGAVQEDLNEPPPVPWIPIDLPFEMDANANDHVNIEPPRLENDDDDNDDDNEALEAQNLVNQLNHELNAYANIDLETFSDLISMPKLTDMKFDLFKTEQIGSILEIGADGNPWLLGNHVFVEDFWEYFRGIQEEPGFQYSTKLATFFPFYFIEVTIKGSKKVK